jgi:predicted HicB family RNase H-like nuclease
MTKDAERFTLRLPQELKRQLNTECRRMGVSLNALMLHILWGWLKAQEGK